MKNMLILSLLLLTGCILKFDGNTFYTIKGRITDTTNRAMPGFDVLILNRGPSFNIYGGYNGDAISAVGKTDIDGNFKLTFPSSNGKCYLELQDGFVILNTIANANYPYNYSVDVRLDTSSFKNYFYNLNTIKVFKK